MLIAGGVAYAVAAAAPAAKRRQGRHGKQSAALKPSEIEVTVLNGTAVAGLAATYGDKVERKGFKLGAVTNSSSSFTESVVMFKPRPRAARRTGSPRRWRSRRCSR